MREPYIRIDKTTGGRSLIVFYDDAVDNFNEAINAARLKYNSEKDKHLPVIAMPDASTLDR